MVLRTGATGPAMFTRAASTLMLLLVSGRAQGQEEDLEILIPKRTCANAPFTYICPLEDFVINIRSIIIYADISDPTQALAANNNTCPINLSRCHRIFKDATDRGFKDLPEYDYFYKWLSIQCNGKKECNGTMPAPDRLHGIDKVCSSEDIAYFVAAYVDIVCIKARNLTTFAPLPETTTPSTHSPSTEPTEEPPVVVPMATGAPGATEKRVISTVAAFKRTTQKSTNNLLNALIDALWVRNEGRSIYFGREGLQQCLLLLALVLLVVLRFES